MWSSNVLLFNSSFSANNASRRGGAISSLALDSSIRVVNTTASGNFAGDVSLANQMLQLASGWPTLQSEGGVVHVSGSRATLELSNVSMEANGAAKVMRVGIASSAVPAAGSWTVCC
jgi:predicted outer membrane repeat protein